MEALAQGTQEIAPKPTASPSSPSDDIDIEVPQAVVTWSDADDNTRCLYHDRAIDSSRRVTFRISYNALNKTTFFQLRVPIQLKSVPNVTPLHLNIPPETIAELTVGYPNEPHQTARQQLGSMTTCLSFRLHRPPQLIVPKGPLAPRRQREHGDKLDCLKLLSQATSLDVYFGPGILQDATARTVCDLATSPMARSIVRYADLDVLYPGKGGVVLSAESTSSPPTTFPPPYNELCATTPPPPPQKDHASPARSSRKRPRQSSFDQVDIESICARAIKDRFALYEKDFQEKLDKLDKLEEKLEDMKKDILDHIDRRMSEIDRLSDTYTREEVDGLIQEARDDGEDYTDNKINDRVLDIKLELKEYTEDQLRDMEERVMKKLKSASLTLNMDNA